MLSTVLSNSAATPLLGSSGRPTTRLQLGCAQGFSSARIAVRRPSPNSKPSFLEKLFWTRTKIVDEQGIEQELMINRRSLAKRLPGSSRALERACKANQLAEQLDPVDLRIREIFLKYTGFNEKEAEQGFQKVKFLEDLANHKEEGSNPLSLLRAVGFPGDIVYKRAASDTKGYFSRGDFYFINKKADVLGSGSYKQVETCEKLNTGELCALLSDKDPTSHAANERELKWLERFSGNQGFPITYGGMTIDEKLCIFQELFSGNLRKAFNLPIEQKRQIALDILAALVYMHKNNIMHGDLKPDNILVHLAPSYVKGAICDFGFTVDLSQNKPKFGTYTYLAPEGFTTDWKKVKDPAAWSRVAKKIDVWAMGLTLFRLFQKELSFEFVYQVKRLKKCLNHLADFYSQTEGSFQALQDFWFKVMVQKTFKDTTDLSEPDLELQPTEHLIWSMLHKEYRKRITAEEALKRLQAQALPPSLEL